MNRFLTLTIGLLLLPALVLAQEVTIHSGITPSGEVAEVVIEPNRTDIKRVEFWFTSKGNESTPLSVYIEAPGSTVAEVKASILGGASVEQKLASSNGWFPLALRGRGEKEKTSFTVNTAASAASLVPIGGTNICAYLSAEQIATMLRLFSQLYGRPVTREEICGGTIDPLDPDEGGDISGPAPAGLNGILQLSGILSKDTCRPDAKSNYLVKVSLDLSGIDPALYQSGITLRGGARATKYRGCKAASIKPESDGKFAPRPLLLMCSGGSYFGGGESIRLRRWRKSRPGRPTSIRVYDHVYYRGLVLTRSPLSVLSGGRGTFELSSGSSTYSVCFSLSATRQRVNGYPG